MAKEKKNYYEKISANNKTTEETQQIRQLFDDNINIANKVASKYYKTGYWDYEEALQIAKMGLWKACLIWDEEKYRLSTLAYNIINRDFMDHDNKQKKQPDILFNLEDNCVTEDISLSEVLVDETADIYKSYEEQEALYELNDNILYALDLVSDEMKLSKSVVKIIYIVYIESTTDNLLNMKSLDFIPKQTIKQVVACLQEKLSDILN